MEDKIYKEFLESQLQWSINQVAILDEMENKLEEMKKVAVYAASKELSIDEQGSLNKCLEILKSEYDRLEKHKDNECY